MFYMLAMLFAVLMLIPGSSIMSGHGAAGQDMVLVDSESANLMEAMGAEIFVDYGNGFYLMKAPVGLKERIEGSDIKAVWMSEKRSIDLYPSSYRFNPSRGVPEIPSNLKGDSDIYIVQFVGPVKAEWVKKVRDCGVLVLDDLPKYAMIARMSPDTANVVRNMPEIAWVGQYEPTYKIASGIDTTGSEKKMLSVLLFRDSNENALAEYLSRSGVTVMSIQDRSLIISAQESQIPLIAGLKSVEKIEAYHPPKPLDLQADKIMHVREMWYPNYTGLGTRFIGIGQVIGIQDTGFDEGDADAGPNDLFQGPVGDRVVRYKDETSGSDPDGWHSFDHGTFSCGLIAGNGWSWEKEYGCNVDDYNWDCAEPVGGAPGAKLSIDGIMSGDSGTLQPSASYWDKEYDDGARIFSNSWGDYVGDYYAEYSAITDDECNADNTRLYIFAAGNQGPQNDTLTDTSQGKNVLCIGATENFRQEGNNGVRAERVADFSSRGGNFSDTRIKPDLVAPGTAAISLSARGQYEREGNNGGYHPYALSGIDQYDWNNKAPGQDGAPDYQWGEGTSVSAPVAAGAAAVIRQYLTDTSYSNDPNSQIIKALMINGARRLPNINYPGYDQGWGRIDVKNSILPEPPTTLQYTEDVMQDTGTWNAASDGGMSLDVSSADIPLKITLVWVDTTGKSLNRDLDLKITDPNGHVYHGNAYGTDGWTVPDETVANTADTFLGSWDRGDGYDGVNNVEQVEVRHPATGTWTVEVIGHNVPSATPFALVVRADIGSMRPQYAVNMQIPDADTLRIAPGGALELPVTIRNYGTSTDTIDLEDNVPYGLHTEYTYGGDEKTSYVLDSGEARTLIMTIRANSSLSHGAYRFHTSAISSGDSSARSVRDLKVDVIDPNERTPPTVKVTDETGNELYPAVTAFTDADGNSWVFVAYVEERPVSTDGIYGGDTVMVKYAPIGSDGMPEAWNGPYQLTKLNELPRDLRIIHGNGGTYRDRVWVIWIGNNPNASVNSGGISNGTWGRIAWADKGDYSSWTCPATGTNTTIDENGGSETYNTKRVNSIQYRQSSSELVYIFEHLDFDNNGAIEAVHNAYCTSTDGGASWSAAQDYDPGGDYFFFPNIMDGGNDYNDVVWSFVYHRGSNGNDRDLSCMVYDGSWGGDSGGDTKETDVLDNDNNLMFPVVAYDKSSGSANRVFFAVLDDTSRKYQISVGYHEGSVSSGIPPPDTSNAWGNVKGPFATEVLDVDYDKRPLMNMISTPDDGGMWIQYLERSTPLGANIKAVYSNDQFDSVSYYNIASNSYAKGHQMSSSVEIGGTDYVYTTYHMSKGELDNADYDIYLAVYHSGFENDADNLPPEILRPAVTPAIYNSSKEAYEIDLGRNSSFEITATVDDTWTGNSGISSAEWMESDTSVTDPTSLDWDSASSMNLTSHTPVEKISAELSPSWEDDTYHRIWIKAEDSAGNTAYTYIDLFVSRALTPVEVDFQAGWNLISLPWLTSPTNITDALNGISWDRAMVYVNGQWYTYNKDRDAKFNLGFPRVDNTMGMWVHTASEGQLSKNTSPITTQIFLSEGWNLVGYPRDTVKTVGDALSSFNGTYDIVETYDPALGDIIELADSDNMEVGKAYWIHVTSTGTWSVEW